MKSNDDKKIAGYILAVALRVIDGGFLVAVIMKAIPKMMAGMMAQMGEGDCEPADIWQKMMEASLKPESAGSS